MVNAWLISFFASKESRTSLRLKRILKNSEQAAN